MGLRGPILVFLNGFPMVPKAQPGEPLDGNGLRFAVVAAQFNERIGEMLLEGAFDCLIQHGVASSDIQVIRVPGAWELPQACEEIAALGKVDAVVALGVLIRGDTFHFDLICTECARGLQRVASQYRLPVSFGVLTCETSVQAEERAGGKRRHKGREAARAALAMARLFQDLRS